jgi:UV DNA damage endonuclease
LPHIHRYGYACINMELAEQKVVTNRGIQLKTFEREGLPKCSELALLNLTDLHTILKWNIDNNILLYRMSSQLFPWMTEYALGNLPKWPRLKIKLEDIGDYVKGKDIRLSFHPGPYNNLGSPRDDVVAKSIVELEAHSKILDYMGLPANHWSKINIHLGGSYGDKEATIARFIKNFPRCSENLRSRFTLENDDRESLYSVGDLVKVHESTGVPIVFDGHHWEVGAKSGSYKEDMLAAYRTWPSGIVPTLHWSNSRKEYEDKDCKVNAHSDWYYKTMPLPNLDCDIMLESKMKERALLKYIKEIE